MRSLKDKGRGLSQSYPRDCESRGMQKTLIRRIVSRERSRRRWFVPASESRRPSQAHRMKNLLLRTRRPKPPAATTRTPMPATIWRLALPFVANASGAGGSQPRLRAANLRWVLGHSIFWPLRSLFQIMSIDRVVMAFAGAMILMSVVLAVTVNLNWLWFTGFIGINLFQAALTGFCPLVLILKKLGVRPGSAF